LSGTSISKHADKFQTHIKLVNTLTSFSSSVKVLRLPLDSMCCQKTAELHMQTNSVSLVKTHSS